MAVEQRAEALLHCSGWRRWHQAWARYYRYRRRERQAAERHRPQGEASPVPLPPRVVADVLWSRLEALLPPAQRRGRPYHYERRRVLEAIMYIKRTGCGWRNFPERFPPWQTVYAQLVRWRESGIWDTLWSEFDNSPVTDELQL